MQHIAGASLPLPSKSWYNNYLYQTWEQFRNKRVNLYQCTNNNKHNKMAGEPNKFQQMKWWRWWFLRRNGEQCHLRRAIYGGSTLAKKKNGSKGQGSEYSSVCHLGAGSRESRVTCLVCTFGPGGDGTMRCRSVWIPPARPTGTWSRILPTLSPCPHIHELSLGC